MKAKLILVPIKKGFEPISPIVVSTASQATKMKKKILEENNDVIDVLVFAVAGSTLYQLTKHFRRTKSTRISFTHAEPVYLFQLHPKLRKVLENVL